VCTGQLSHLPFAGRETSSSLRAMGWRPSVADWGSGMSVCCTVGQLFASTCNGWLHNASSIISSCQSAATSKVAKCFWSQVSRKQRYSKYPTFTFTFTSLPSARCLPRSSSKLTSCQPLSLSQFQSCFTSAWEWVNNVTEVLPSLCQL